jgi:undecaprenol kinase
MQFDLTALLRSFGYAGQGVKHTWRTQQNFRIHVLVSVCVLLAGAVVGLSAAEWAVIILTIGVVMQAELFNTAIEAIVDKASPEHHPLAKAAKDCAAGAVVLSAIAAVIIGVIIFVPKLLRFIV